ncbi:MAG: EF-hand domain-containing protein [Proteobacteria bacterium]|nr:EF-hand domain-containing protein [Pseudomonadota bacterium]MDA1309730.1 EF-hand domain-containing protein [Pseudomonadota bacterium]
MTIVRTFLLIAVAAALPFAGAMADAPKPGAKPPHAGVVSPHAAMMKEHFGQMDANKDGGVSQSETYDYRKSQFTAADTDGNGTLSISELDAAMAVFRADHLKQRLARMDTDGDGTVDAEEFARHQDHRMSRLDVNRDGVVAMQEIEMAASRHGRHNQGGHMMHGHGGRN